METSSFPLVVRYLMGFAQNHKRVRRWPEEAVFGIGARLQRGSWGISSAFPATVRAEGASLSAVAALSCGVGKSVLFDLFHERFARVRITMFYR